MSTYIRTVHPERHAPYLDIPDDVVEYLHYLDFVKQRSPRTINGYYIDLRGFFRFMAVQWGLCAADTPPDKIDLTKITTRQITAVSKRDIFHFLEYAQENANGPKGKSKKIVGFARIFGYLHTQMGKLEEDPTTGISLGAKKALPKYLTLDESLALLNNIQSDFYSRDYCILTLFLNCGMRLAELVAIDLSDFRDQTIRIIGKGHKERLVYLNAACQEALERYKKERAAMPNLADRQALFVSKRTGKRLTARRVEQIVARCLQSAGLNDMGFSPHKLRHTAATLMYQYGGADMLTLKEILGHANVSTTQIYTHINQTELRQAVEASPLSRVAYPEEKSASDTAAAPAETEPADAAGTGTADLQQDTGKQDR